MKRLFPLAWFVVLVTALGAAVPVQVTPVRVPHGVVVAAHPEASAAGVTLHLRDDTPLDPAKLAALIRTTRGQWGLTPDIKEIADRYATEGFLAFAPDLYHGKVASEPSEAGKLMMETIDFRLDKVLTDVTSLIADKIFGKGVELLFGVDPTIPNELSGQPSSLRFF